MDYNALIRKSGLGSTPNRLSVLEIVGNSSSPLTAQEVFDTLNRTQAVNRVTVYRILELLVESRLLERVSGGDRTFRYGLSAGCGRKHHPHFYCTGCGGMECLNPETVQLDVETFRRTFPGMVEKVEVRIDGLCKNCLKQRQKDSGPEQTVDTMKGGKP